MNLSELEEKIWHYHDQKGGTLTLNNVIGEFTISEQEAKNALDNLAELGIESKVVSWSMAPFVSLKRPYWPQGKKESIKETQKETQKETRKETQPPPPTNSKSFEEKKKPKPSLDSDQKKILMSTAKENARRLVIKYNLRTEEEFQECQVCGARDKDPEIHIPNLEYPELINVMCHSCIKSGEEAPPISIREVISKKTKRNPNLPRIVAKRRSMKNANTNKLNFKNTYSHLMPDFTCQICGASEPDVSIRLKIIDPDKPYRVVPLCASCHQEYIHHKKYTQELKTISLLEIVGIHVPKELIPYEYEIISQMRRKGNLRCHLAPNKALGETTLYLGNTDSAHFYLACEEHAPTAKEDLKDGFGNLELTEIFL